MISAHQTLLKRRPQESWWGGIRFNQEWTEGERPRTLQLTITEALDNELGNPSHVVVTVAAEGEVSEIVVTDGELRFE